MTDERKAALMAYCRIDELDPTEEPLLTALYDSAVSYMEQAGITQPETGSARCAQYDFVVNAMVLDGWDNRGGHITGAQLVENPMFRRMLNQLKLTEAVPDEGADGQ